MSGKVSLTEEIIETICEKFKSGTCIPDLMREYGWGRNKITSLLKRKFKSEYASLAKEIIRSCGKKSSLKLKGRKNPHTQEWNSKIAESLRGRSLSEDTKNKISQSSKTRLERGTLTREKLLENAARAVETKRKNRYFELHSKRHSEWMKENAPMRGKKMTEETKEKMRLAKKRFLDAGESILPPRMTAGVRTKISESISKMWKEGRFDKKNGVWRSKLEISIYEECLKYDSESKHSFRLSTPERTYIYDVFIPSKNLIIEINGDYWHYNPKMFEGTFFDKSRNILAQDVWDLDLRKRSAAQNEHNVLTLWEDDINTIGIESIIKSIFV